MAFFQQLCKLFTSPTTQQQDFSFGLIDSLNVKRILEHQQWEQLDAIAAELAPDDLTRLLDGLCLTSAYSDSLSRYQKAGESDFRQLTTGVHATFLAWQARGGTYAKHLVQKQIGDFTSYLQQAHKHLNRSFDTLNFRVEAAARMVRVAMGLSEPELVQEAFDCCTELNSIHLQAHLFYFNFLTPKWFGDEDKLENFVINAPSKLQKLLEAMYLVELYVAVADSSAIMQQKFKNENKLRIDRLLEQVLPLTDKSLYAVYLNNYLAGLNHILDRPEVCTTFLQELGNRITYFPWAYLGLYQQTVQKLVKV